jgi:ABC-type amino acid transport substrate-binding protein
MILKYFTNFINHIPLMKFSKFLLAALLLVFICAPQFIKAQDTATTSNVSHTVGRSTVFTVTLDSAQTVAGRVGWIDITATKEVDVYLNVKFTDLTFGRSANNDTVKVRIIGRDAYSSPFSYVDTTAIIVSTGVLQQFKLSPTTFLPEWMIEIINFNTGSAKNGNGEFKASLYTYPK